MLRLAVVLLVIALTAALFGFGVISNSSVQGAKVLFFAFLALAFLTFFIGVFKRLRIDSWTS